jgi:cytochrome oxidase Cu insertion factor (SCO1/SenC/PrrC family)
MPPTAANASAAGREERLFLGIVIGLALVTALGSWLAVLALKHHERPDAIAVDQPRSLVDFTLTDRTGRTVTRAEIQGKVLVVSFLFTSCSLTCPEVSRRMADIQHLTDGQPDVRLLSLTVDPRTDTTNNLAKWADRYGAETNRWYLLTGAKPELYRLIATSFLKQDNTDPFNSMPGNFTGTERIALVDRHGHTRAFYDGLSPQTPDAIADQVRELLAEP